MRRMKQLSRTGRLEHRRRVGCLGLEAVPHAWESRMTWSFVLELVAWSRCRAVFTVLLCWTGTTSLVWSQERPASPAAVPSRPRGGWCRLPAERSRIGCGARPHGRTAVAKVPVTSSIADEQPQPSRADVEDVAPGEREFVDDMPARFVPWWRPAVLHALRETSDLHRSTSTR